MTTQRHLRARYRTIMRFATRYIVQEWWYELLLPRLGLARITQRTRARRVRNIAQHFHRLAVELGGLMIKVGQFMSSRLDVLPPEITSELEGLQDEVPAADFDQIRALAETDLGVPLERAYTSFDPTPLAAASLGQVHRATLAPADADLVGFEDVVVKVQRPGIDAIVSVDLAALKKIAHRLNRVAFINRRVDLPALLREFATVSLEEIDYLHEGANAERFTDNFADNPAVRAPTVVWERTTRRVLTLSDVTAIKISDRDRLRAAGIDPAAVAEALSTAMFDQLFTHGFFHADPHPGNIFVTPGTDTGWALSYVDFGMMGAVPDNLRGGMQKLVIAVATRDAKGLVSAIRDMGMLLPTAESAPLELALSDLFARFGGMGFAELQKLDPSEFKDFADKFGRTMRTMPFQLPEDLLLIIRAVSLTSGVCTALNPSFNVWTAIEPYAEQLTQRERGAAVRSVGQQLLTSAGDLVRLPGQLDALSTLIQRGEFVINVPGLERRILSFEHLARRVLSAIIFAGLLLGGIYLKQSDETLGWVLIAGSALPLLHAMFSGMTRRRDH